jgi:spermidine synthase
MKSLSRTVERLVVATGVASVVAQLTIIREYLTAFQGNEFVIALILFGWLAWGGLGTLSARLLTRRRRRIHSGAIVYLSLALAALAVVQLAAVRLLRDVIFIPGTSVGFYPTLSCVMFGIGPYGFLVGFLLPASLFLLRQDTAPDYPGARIYILDNLGDVTGGALFTFVLVYWATPFQAAALAGLPLVAAAIGLGARGTCPTFGRWSVAALVMVVMLLGVLLERQTLAPINGRLAYYEESRFGRVIATQQNEQVTIFKDGVPLLGAQNVALAEESVHYPLSQIKRPSAVLLVSSEGEMLREVFKHRAQRIDLVELDPVVTAAQFRFGLLESVPGLAVHHRDGRAFLKDTDRRYDAIIVNLPEPDTFQINRFYTDEFFALVRRRLTSDGVFSFSMQGVENYLAAPQQRKLAMLYHTAARHFAAVQLLPGLRIFFICRQQPVNLDIPAALARRDIETPYIQGYFDGNLTAERITQLNALVNVRAAPNTDFQPRLMRFMFDQWFARFDSSPLAFFLIMGGGLAFYLLRMTAAEFVLFSTGFMTMGSEILVIFAFQVLFGYIYFQIGLIVTVFLAGLLPGAWLGSRLAADARRVLSVGDGLLVVLMGGGALVLAVLGDALPASALLVFGFLVALVCGFQFPAALTVEGERSTAVTRIFSADLMGASVGTLITSVGLIPYAGLLGTAAGLIGLKLISLIVVGMSANGHQS